jgi:hypothetical protein
LTTTAENGNADDQPPTVAAGNDETAFAPPLTEAALELAWSHDEDDNNG